MTRQDSQLESLRAEIDRLDQEIHERYMARAQIVQKISAAKASNGDGHPKFRPGREANVIRNLISRHKGPLKREALAAIWREMMSASVDMQNPLKVLVAGGADPLAMWDLARGHFGNATEMHLLASPAAALQIVDQTHIAVLPLPGEGATNAWWHALAQSWPDGRPQIVAKIPFLADTAEHEALVVAQIPWDPSGQDEMLLAVYGEDVDFTKVGRVIAKRTNGGVPGALVALSEPLDEAALVPLQAELGAAQIVPLGGYALPPFGLV